MRLSSIERVSPTALPSALPIRLEQQPSAIPALLKLMVVLPAASALIYPFLLLGQALASDPSMRAVLAAKPAVAVQLALGLAFWIVLFGWPIKRLSAGLSRGRDVAIENGDVTVVERGLLKTESWTAPLASYRGVIHHVRASLSGVRHELILVHPQARKSVLLTIADRISESEISRVAELLRQAEVPSRAIYDLPRRWQPAAAPEDQALDAARSATRAA